MLSPEFGRFCRDWRAKADAYSTDETQQCFDKFFTLYVLFNRLYAEATFSLARSRPDIKRKIDRAIGFPDAQAATSYLLDYLSATTLIDAITDDRRAIDALGEIKRFLRANTFHIRLDKVTGDPQPTADAKLLAQLESRNTNERATAILEAIYAIRCNMFHGHKAFQPMQSDLLRPMITILVVVIEVTQNKLQGEP